MNIYKIAFIACSIFQIAHGAAENALSLRENSTQQLMISGRTKGATHSTACRCAKKTVACIECTGCTLCCTCALISCATTPTCYASFCIMGLSVSGACGIKSALANIATNVCMATCIPGVVSFSCCLPGFKEGKDPIALKIDQCLVKWSGDSDSGEIQEAEPLLDTTPLSSQLQRDE